MRFFNLRSSIHFFIFSSSSCFCLSIARKGFAFFLSPTTVASFWTSTRGAILPSCSFGMGAFPVSLTAVGWGILLPPLSPRTSRDPPLFPLTSLGPPLVPRASLEESTVVLEEPLPCKGASCDLASPESPLPYFSSYMRRILSSSSFCALSRAMNALPFFLSATARATASFSDRVVILLKLPQNKKKKKTDRNENLRVERTFSVR